MKKKVTKKLTLGKIKIASLNNNDQAKINGGLARGPVTNTIIKPTTDPTAQTWCFICPAITTECI